jgi:hypothetical protein
MSPIYVPGKVTLAKDYTEGDRYFSNVSLLLHGDGTNGSTTITDSSPTPKTVTVVGNAQISTAQSKFGGASIAFDGTGDYLTIPSNADFNFDTGDFTIEAWVRLNALGTSNGYPGAAWIVGWGPLSSNPGFDFAIGSTNLIFSLTNFSSPTISVAHSLSANTWYHIAGTRSGTTVRAFIDGQVLATETVSAGLSASTNPTGIAISAAEPTGSTLGNLNGYIDDFRITKGVARYTSNFTPPTAPFADAQY